MSVTETEPKNNPELSATEDVLITRNDRMLTKLTNPNQGRIRIAKSHTGQKISYAWHKKVLRWFVAFGLILLAGIGGIVSGKFSPNRTYDIVLASGSSDDRPSESEETNAWVEMLKRIPKKEFRSAVSYEENRIDVCKRNHVVLLAKNKDADFRLYGYETRHQVRGLIANYQGTWSYFDLYWDSWHFPPALYWGDFDGDSQEEIAMISPGGYGTGTAIDSLGIFEIGPDHTLSYTEVDVMSWSWVKQQLKPLIKFDRTEGKVRIPKKDGSVHEIDLTTAPEYQQEKDQVRVVYNTWISFQVQGDQIKMLVQVFGCANASMCYLSDVENTIVAFDLLYHDQTFTVGMP